jgi:hypothetical protein
MVMRDPPTGAQGWVRWPGERPKQRVRSAHNAGIPHRVYDGTPMNCRKAFSLDPPVNNRLDEAFCIGVCQEYDQVIGFRHP